MLTVNQLTLTHRKDLTVLVDSLSFTLNDGERLALIGEEGNGNPPSCISSAIRLKSAPICASSICRRMPATCWISPFPPSSCSPRPVKRNSEAAPASFWAA